jgi:hypothetical protein
MMPAAFSAKTPPNACARSPKRRWRTNEPIAMHVNIAARPKPSAGPEPEPRVGRDWAQAVQRRRQAAAVPTLGRQRTERDDEAQPPHAGGGASASRRRSATIFATSPVAVSSSASASFPRRRS